MGSWFSKSEPEERDPLLQNPDRLEDLKNELRREITSEVVRVISNAIEIHYSNLNETLGEKLSQSQTSIDELRKDIAVDMATLECKIKIIEQILLDSVECSKQSTTSTEHSKHLTHKLNENNSTHKKHIKIKKHHHSENHSS